MTDDPRYDDPRHFDIDPTETREWIDSLREVLEHDGADRARFLLDTLLEEADRRGAGLPPDLSTPYVNTIPAEDEERRPGDGVIERRIKSLVRWNAAAMVVRANQRFAGLGGHIGTFASAANLYEVGFNYFFRASDEDQRGDVIFYQGHSSPGFYARAFLEGRLGEEDLESFRREVEKPGLSSYPHPWLMPGFWSVPTVSMGLGPILAIYQARFMKYLEKRGIIKTEGRKVWAFLGDGEMDEPEAVGALSVAGREKLDNLIFVVNCNLQRLDGPVRGNGKIIQELEGLFRGAGWNVIKVVWGGNWDPLLARDEKGLLRHRMLEAVDGDYQAYAAHDGAYVRKHFFGTSPELAEMVEDMTDDQLWKLRRGGHDPQKVYAAYAAAVKTKGRPTVVLAKTVKGYGMGEAGEGQNIIHQQKKMDEDELVAFRDRFDIPLSDEDARKAVFYRPHEDSETIRYLKRRRALLGGPLPVRRVSVEPLKVPGLHVFSKLLESSGEREMSTTMAFVRGLMALTRNEEVGKRLVPIVADEARTFGMEGLFRQLGIYAPEGQLYEPVDKEQLAYYREVQDGQILQEGITEAGAFSSWAAAGTAYSHHGIYMIPFFIFYSMFGFQRIGDLIWAAADMRARGFLIGGTSGRTTLNGEGLQHEDGHSHLHASTVPTCAAYDPTYAYEVAVILHDGLKRMYQDEEDVFYYITTLNENYEHPEMPKGAEEGIRRGLYRLTKSKSRKKLRVQLLGCGAILREVLAAADLLEEDYGVAADVWSVTSFTELRRDGLATTRWNRLHPTADRRRSWVEEQLADTAGPVVAASDYLKTFADQIRAWVPRRYEVLGTDGFGRSDTREELRRFFEVDRYSVAVTALKALADEGAIPAQKVAGALERYHIDPEKPDPVKS
jgi:pyruvate dehydrogenase E1 component